MRIHLESCHLSRVSGFVDPAAPGAAVVVRIGRHETWVPASTPRADLPASSAFRHEIGEQERAALRDGTADDLAALGFGNRVSPGLLNVGRDFPYWAASSFL
jgi:hypothetical protein